MRSNLACIVLAVGLASCATANAQVSASNPYPTMAPISKYMMPRDAEIQMARSAAPASVSAKR